MVILANRHFGLHENIPKNFSFITIYSEIYPKTTTLKSFGRTREAKEIELKKEKVIIDYRFKGSMAIS